MTLNHAHFMRRALALARKGRGRVHPNPMVGCVVVQGTKIVGEGFHPYYGGPHAEVVALKKAGRRARGAVLYLTLEPCTHWGKTPPCLPVVVESGVKKAFVAMKDPNPLVSGAGIAGLKAAKIAVQVGLEASAARKLNPFMTKKSPKRPHCLLKLAISLDGKTATRTGDSKWISSSRSRRQVHELRAQSDAVLVGAETARRDNPSLTTHGRGRNPIRVVLDPHLRTPVGLKLYNDLQARTVIVTSDRVAERRLFPYRKRGVQILRNSLRYEKFELKDVLRKLSKLNVNQLLIEGGQKTAEAFISQNLIDEVAYFIAPVLIGGQAKIRHAHKLNSWSVRKSGPDLLVRGRVK